MAKPVPPAFDLPDSPPDDPGCILTARLYTPNVSVWGPGPYPGWVCTRAGGFTDGGPNESNAMLWDLCDMAGYICMFFDVRLAKNTNGQGGLPPEQHQTTDGAYSQQTDDFQIGTRYMRNHPLCNGFVGGAGGSGSGSHAAYWCVNGTSGDNKLDCAIVLSGNLNGGERTNVSEAFISKNKLYYLRAGDADPDDPATITARSPIAFVDATTSPIYFANGTAENMPFTVFNDFKAALDGVPLTNYFSRVNISQRHSFGTWFANDSRPENNRDPALAFVANIIAQWNGGGGGGLKPQPFGNYNLTPAPEGHCVVTGKSFLTNPNVSGVRIRPRWNVFNPVSAAYDWTELDAVLDTCAAAGKFVGISIAAGVGTPAWVYTTAPTCTKFTLAVDDRTTDAFEMPLPWQTGFLSKWQTFVTAMGAKLDPNPFVSYIGVTGFMQLVNMVFVQTDADLILTDAIAVADGYADTEEALTFAGKAIIDMFAAAFPTTSMMLTIDDLIPGPAGGRAKLAIRDYGEATYPNRIGRWFSNLLATLPPHDPPILPLDPFPKGFQPLNPSNHSGIYGIIDPDPYPLPPQPFEDQGLHCWSNGGKVFEPYEGDVDDLVNQPVLAEIQNLLLGGPPPPPDPPFISGSSPEEGAPGDTVTINGGNFTGATSVLFGGVTASSFTVFSNTLIAAIVSPSAVTGPITVITPNGSATGSFFTVVIEQIPPPPTGSTTRSPILRYPIGGRPPLRKTKPDPPMNVLVTVSGIAGDNTATATWDPPSNDGGSPITSYSGQVNPGPGGVAISGPDDRSADISGLPLDSDQTYTMSATNAYGQSDLATFDFRTNPTVIVPPPPGSEPRGVYRILDTNLVTGFPIWSSAPFWTMSYIDGSRYEARWDKLNPAYDPQTGIHTYDWVDLDQYLDKCELFSKRAIISVANGIYAPTWLKTLAATRPGGNYTESGPNAGTMAFPWNDVAMKFWFNFLKVLGVHLISRTSITAIVAAGFGQVVESIISDNATDTATLTANATNLRYASAADGWLNAAERSLVTCNSAFLRQFFILTLLEWPVPVGTAVKDGNMALDNLATYVSTTLPTRMGFMANGLTSITRLPNPLVPTEKKYEITYNNSMAGVAAGYRFLAPSTNTSVDPTQDPDAFDSELAFRNVIAKGVSLKAKFLEIWPVDADNVDVDYVTDMTNAQTSLAANP